MLLSFIDTVKDIYLKVEAWVINAYNVASAWVVNAYNVASAWVVETYGKISEFVLAQDQRLVYFHHLCLTA